MEAKQNTVQSLSPTSGTRWVMIRTRPKDGWKTLTLPLTVGSSGSNDIMVNAPTMASLSKVVIADQDVLSMVDVHSQSQAGLETLKVFQIELIGPFHKNPQSMWSLQRQWHSFLIAERHWYHKRKARLGKVLSKKQGLRLLSYTAVTGLLLTGLIVDGNPPPTVVDYSQRSLPAEVNSIKLITVESSSASDPYAKGFQFEIPLSEENLAQQFVLSLEIAGLDQAKEFSIHVNRKFIGSINPQMRCVDEFCTLDFKVSSDLMTTGPNTIFFQHHTPSSSYSVRKFFFRQMEQATAEHREKMIQYYESAQRYYDERFIMVDNIRQAQSALDEATLIQSTHYGLEDYTSKLNLLREQIDAAFEAQSKELQFQLSKSLKLDRYDEARNKIESLLKLYPEPSSREHEQLQGLRKKLDAMKPKS